MLTNLAPLLHVGSQALPLAGDAAGQGVMC